MFNRSKVILPPFMAVTANDLYYDRTNAQERGFIMGRHKIRYRLDIEHVFNFLKEEFKESLSQNFWEDFLRENAGTNLGDDKEEIRIGASILDRKEANTEHNHSKCCLVC